MTLYQGQPQEIISYQADWWQGIRAAERKRDPKTAEKKLDRAAQPQALLRHGGEQQGTMGTSLTKGAGGGLQNHGNDFAEAPS